MFKVLFFGMKFSSLSLKTEASLISKNLFKFSEFSFLKSNPKVNDLPDSKLSKPSLLWLKILFTFTTLSNVE